MSKPKTKSSAKPGGVTKAPRKRAPRGGAIAPVTAENATSIGSDIEDVVAPLQEDPGSSADGTSPNQADQSEAPAPQDAPPSEPLNYEVFIRNKSQLDGDFGFEPLWMPDFLFDFQAFLLEWNLRKGRSATFANCGLGKSPLELVWCQNVLRHTNKPSLILTPLAVSHQFVTEGEKFGVEVHRIRDGKIHHGVNVTNYEQLHKLNPHDFGGVACDESSVIKHDESVTRAAVTEFLRTIRFRLLGTATAAPNDLPELGTSSEALGYLGNMDMLNRFFKNDRNNSVDTKGKWRGHAAPRTYTGPQWRFRGHAEEPFWRWVCSWARSIRKPSDFGFDDGAFILPELIERTHEVRAKTPPPGMLFALPAHGLREERAERRRTIRERCEMVAEIVSNTGQPSVSWCQLNDEGDLLEELIPGAIQVSGKDSDDAKEEKLLAFSSGQAPKLVTKPVLGAWGLNWQHCAHMTSFVTHSFEQDYQSIRRCYRFGQTKPVVVDRVLSDGETHVLDNLRRKEAQAEQLFENVVRYMREAMHIDNRRSFSEQEEWPSWL